MPKAQSPFVVLIHGAFHGAWCWAALQADLDRRSIASLAPDLPGHGASLEPLGDLHGDARSVRALLDRLGVPVVLVTHSYGGAVATEAAAGHPDVSHIVYVSAFVPDQGEAVLGLAQTLPTAEYALPAAMVMGETSCTIDPSRARAVFYGECTQQVASAAAARLDAQSLATFSQPANVAAWRSIPSTYVRCLRDQAIPLAHQDVMSNRCKEIITIDTDHSPFISRTGELADIVERIVLGSWPTP